jgi:lipooligosaccharide transport system permease protein
MYQYRRTWRGTAATSFLNPILYLAAIGVGLGSIVDQSTSSVQKLGGVDYAVFIAPGLLAASAMQLGATESAWPVMDSIKWTRVYHAMLATPLRVADVILGHLGYVMLRLFVSASVFLVVMTVFGASESWTAVFAVPAAVLTGLAFAAPCFALSGKLENDASYNYVFRFGVIPLFLFSGTFFPISQLPAALQVIAYVTPLYHGVTLCRSLTLGTASLAASAGHVLYLSVFVIGGLALALRTFTKRLVP